MIADADDYLKRHKRFHGIFGIGANARRMLAVQMVEVAQEKDSMSGSVGGAALSSAISSSVEIAIITLLMMNEVAD